MSGQIQIKDDQNKIKTDLEELTQLACRLGASGAAVIPTSEISIEDDLATLFCRDHIDCRVLAEGGACRNSHRARPSMSGFGINVSKLMKSAGWHLDRITRDTDPDDVPMGSVSGLVLVC
jgi:hypothetical protein